MNCGYHRGCFPLPAISCGREEGGERRGGVRWEYKEYQRFVVDEQRSMVEAGWWIAGGGKLVLIESEYTSVTVGGVQ